MEPESSLPCSKQPPRDPLLSQMNQNHSLALYLFKVYFLFFHVWLGFQSDLFLKVSVQNCFTLSHLHAYYMPHPSHPTWFDYPKIFLEAYKLWNSWLCKFLYTFNLRYKVEHRYKTRYRREVGTLNRTAAVFCECNVNRGRCDTFYTASPLTWVMPAY
jgi:hypothetical protein